MTEVPNPVRRKKILAAYVPEGKFEGKTRFDLGGPKKKVKGPTVTKGTLPQAAWFFEESRGESRPPNSKKNTRSEEVVVGAGSVP